MLEALRAKEKGPAPGDHILLILQALEKVGQPDPPEYLLCSLCSFFRVGNYIYAAYNRPNIGTVMYPSSEDEATRLGEKFFLLENNRLVTQEDRQKGSLEKSKFRLTDKGREYAQQLATQYPQETASIETTIQELTQKEGGFERTVLVTAYKVYISRRLMEMGQLLSQTPTDLNPI